MAQSEHEGAGWLADEVSQLPHALWVPLDKEPVAVLRSFAAKGLIDGDYLLDGLLHPSGANAERIAYFLGRKRRENLPVKVIADAIDTARDQLVLKVKSRSTRRSYTEATGFAFGRRTSSEPQRSF